MSRIPGLGCNIVVTCQDFEARKKLVSIGNSYGIVIDRPILELLGMTPESEIEITTDGTSLVLPPVGAMPSSTTPPASEGERERPRRSREPPPKLPKPARGARTPRFGIPKKQPW